MYPGLPSRMERDIRTRYLNEVLHGDQSKLSVRRPALPEARPTALC